MNARALKILTKMKLLLLLLVLPVVAQAQYYYTNGLDIWSYTPSTGPLTITGYSGPGGTLIIPSTINGYLVTSIGSAAFYGFSIPTTVTIPATVTNIGSDAFSGGCFDLDSVSIPASVTSIGYGAFQDCGNLTNIAVDASNPDYSSFGGALFDKAQTTLIEFPSGLGGSYNFVPSFPASLTTVGQGAFDACTQLRSMNLPNSVTTIGQEAFIFCNNLTNVTIGAGITNIGSYAFQYCSSLTGVYFLGNSPKPTNDSTVFYGDNTGTIYDIPGTTGWSALFDSWPTKQLNLSTNFTYTTNNSAITITGYIGSSGMMLVPSTINGYPVTTIQYNAFQGNSRISSVTIIGTNLTSIGDQAFYGCYNLTSVNLPNSVTNIDGYAFSGCYLLTSFILPTNIVSIGGSAFTFSGLTAINIPASVTSMNEAFSSCSRLMNITVAASNPAYSSLNGVLFDKAQDTLLQFPGGLAGNYDVPSSVNTIEYVAFENCNNVNSVMIPASVTNIEGLIFYGCGDLTNITVAASNPDYSSLNGILFDKGQDTLLDFPGGLGGNYSIPNTVTSFPGIAFYDCYLLTSLTIPNSVTNIVSGAFQYCTGLTNVTIGNGVTNIGSYSFYGCNNLTGVYFQGNSPIPTNDSTVFSGDSQGIVYILPGTTGWGTMFDGLPIATWLPQMQTGNSNFGIQSNQFGFNINWAGNRVVVVEATTNIFNPVWVPVSTNTLANGASSFSDPLWTNYPGRYYRLATQ